MIEGLGQSQKSGHVSLLIRVQLCSNWSQIVGLQNGILKVSLSASPVRNEANQQLIGFPSKTLNFLLLDIRLIASHRSRIKTVSIRGITQKELCK